MVGTSLLLFQGLPVGSHSGAAEGSCSHTTWSRVSLWWGWCDACTPGCPTLAATDTGLGANGDTAQPLPVPASWSTGRSNPCHPRWLQLPVWLLKDTLRERKEMLASPNNYRSRGKDNVNPWWLICTGGMSGMGLWQAPRSPLLP